MLLKRILIHGGLTALTLAAIGWLLAQMAGMYVASQSTRGDAAAQGDEVSNAVMAQMPMALALGGFLFVAIGEVIRHLWSGSKQLNS